MNPGDCRICMIEPKMAARFEASDKALNISIICKYIRS